jgi:hypothetical protein
MRSSTTTWKTLRRSVANCRGSAVLALGCCRCWRTLWGLCAGARVACGCHPALDCMWPV